MAITDFTSLKTAIDGWSDTAGSIPDDQLGEFVQFATAMFNFGSDEIPALRTLEMQDVVTLTPVSTVCALPDDYLQYRRVTIPASFRQPLLYITPEMVDERFPDRPAGTPCNFTIIGSSLYVLPTTANDVELTYFQKIPELTDDDPTNWLLAKNPALYLHASLFQLAMYRRDDDLQSRSAAMIMSLMNGMTRTDTLGSYAYAQTTVSGMVIA
jgi:hypothetical protein